MAAHKHGTEFDSAQRGAASAAAIAAVVVNRAIVKIIKWHFMRGAATLVAILRCGGAALRSVAAAIELCLCVCNKLVYALVCAIAAT